jgi:probable phosphoglycerate mutase
MAEQIYLIRHGETRWSRTNQHTGSTDLPLTHYGEEQSQHLGRVLSGMRFAHVLVSPMQRARQTCALAGLGAVARVDPDLREWSYGEYEGLTLAEIRKRRPDWEIYRDGAPGGESPDQVTSRADRVLVELRAMIGRIAVFSHGHLLRALAARWIGLPIQQGCNLALDTASLSMLAYDHNDPDVPVISLWNAVRVPHHSDEVQSTLRSERPLSVSP